MNNPARMAEITARCFDRAMLEMGPAQLNIPRDYFYGEVQCEIPKPMRLAAMNAIIREETSPTRPR